jgi:hypothetical protein
MSSVEQEADGSTIVSITDHPDLGLKTSINRIDSSAKIEATLAPQILIEDIQPTSGTDSIKFTKTYLQVAYSSKQQTLLAKTFGHIFVILKQFN